MRKLVLIILASLAVLVCTFGIIYAAAYCDKNPPAAVCQENSQSPDSDDDEGGDDNDGEDCDHDDSVAKGDMECIGIPGKEGTVTATRKPTTSTPKTQPNKGNTINTKKTK
jgi:hypothetical protein